MIIVCLVISLSEKKNTTKGDFILKATSFFIYIINSNKPSDKVKLFLKPNDYNEFSYIIIGNSIYILKTNSIFLYI